MVAETTYLPWVLISLCLHPSYYLAHSISYPTLTLTRGSVCCRHRGLTWSGGGGDLLLTIHLAFESFPLFFPVTDKPNGQINILWVTKLKGPVLA